MTEEELKLKQEAYDRCYLTNSDPDLEKHLYDREQMRLRTRYMNRQMRRR